MKTKLVIVIFMVGVSAINSAAIDTPGNQFNLLRNPRTNLLQGVNVQESETNFLTPRISSNVKGDSNIKNLGGYRPLFPPYFPLNNPFASKKMYYDKEYYTRGNDEFDILNIANHDRDNFARSRPIENLQTTPIQESFPTLGNNNVKNYQQRMTSYSFTNVRTFDHSPRNIGFWSSDPKIKNDHEVTFITYS